MYRLMIVEDDLGISSAIKEIALKWDFEVFIADDFRNILSDMVQFSPHIILLDIGLPFFNGYHWCSEIRKVSKVPIIIISSASDNINMVLAMNLGADDFIVKPFDLSVLMAKVNALIRRTYDFIGTVSLIEHRGAILDTEEYTITYKSERLELTKNEFKILLTLMENRGKVISREKLMEKLWESDAFVDDNTLTVNVNRIRKKLESIGLTDFIHTKFGVGYQIQGD